jgi:AbrB family looped-hinge helix DNA binding protein
MTVLEQVHVRLGKNGRVVIPAEWREKLGMGEGDELVLTFGPDGFRIQSALELRKQAQQRMMKYKPKGRSGVDDLIAERRKETARG